MKAKIWICFMSAMLMLLSSNIATAQDYMPDQVLVKFHKSVGRQMRQVAVNSVQGTVVKTFKSDTDLLHLKVPDAIGTDTAIANLSQNPNVQYAVRNDIYYLTQDPVYPNDKRFGQQWVLDNISDVDMDAPEAWNIFTGSTEIIVAVLDGGVDYTHGDLGNNMWTNEDEIAGNGIDDDKNGYIDDIYGYDFAYHDNNPMDVGGHGTASAGIIGAIGNNGLGISGINWKVRIMAVKTHNDSGFATAVDVIEGIHYAVDNGARITSNGWGNSTDKCNTAVADAIEYAQDKGVLCVFASRNEPLDVDLPENNFCPACMEHDNIISVTSVDKGDNQIYSWGQTSVDMAAFGIQVTTTQPNNRYTVNFGGNSAACPQVAGVAALVWCNNQRFTYSQVKERLMSTVRPVPSLVGKCVTEGTVNAYNALNPGEPPPPPEERPAAPSNLTANARGKTAIALTWNDNSGNEEGFKIYPTPGGVYDIEANTTSYLDTGLDSKTTFSYKVCAYNSWGENCSNIAKASTK